MGRRLAEATKACRTRRTCGEMGLRFFLAFAEARVLFLAGAFWAGERGAVADDAAGAEEMDWAAADDKKPSQSRRKVPAKNTTARRRTQTLPTAESWHP